MSKREKILELAGAFLLSVMLGGSLSVMLTRAMDLSAGIWTGYLSSAAIALLLSVAMYSRGAALASLALAVAGAITAGARGVFAALGELSGALMDYASGGTVMLTEYAPVIAAAVAILLTLAIHWMCRMSGGVYPALTLTLIIMMGCWLMKRQLDYDCVIPALAALAAMFARAGDERFAYTRALPAALIAATLAFMLIPAGNPTWPPLEDAANRVRQLFYDYFMFTETRTTYSLYQDGFQPQGEMLGGPADPDESPVMLVRSDDALLLRGSIKRTYTTYSWVNSAVNNRYLFVDPTKRATRDEIFDSGRLDGLDASGAFKEVTASVTMLGDGISTLYTPHRLVELSAGLDLAVYYNSSGEVFITRGVMSGDSYEFTAQVPTNNTSAMARLLEQAALQGDARYADIRSEYTLLPRGIEQGVYDLTERVIAGASTEYEKALAIQDHLMNSYTYSQEVGYPPRDRDFVSYFLLESKEGYCSYFASAFAVMCRIAGLPTRYIEGYLAPASGQEGRVITGRNAHAWAEVYFEGVGWISFNPTPGSGDTTPGESGGGEGRTGDADGGDEQDQTDGETWPTQAPEEDGGQEEQPEDEPEEEPEEEPGEEDADGEEDGQDGMEEDLPDAPEEEENQTASGGEETDSQDDTRDMRYLAFIALIVLAVAAAAAWVYHRLRASDPVARAAALEDDAKKLIVWYRALILLLACQGQVSAADETPAMFAQRLRAANICRDEMVYLARALCESRYANRQPDPAVFKLALSAYQYQIAALKPMEKIGWYRARIFSGLGDMERVP